MRRSHTAEQCTAGAVAAAIGDDRPATRAAILAGSLKWVNGTVLHYCFFTKGHFAVPKAQATGVRRAIDTWNAVGIGLEFTEVKQLSEAEVRIGYSEADGSSASAVGRDVLRVPLNQPTTVYGWNLNTKYGRGRRSTSWVMSSAWNTSTRIRSPGSHGTSRRFMTR